MEKFIKEHIKEITEAVIILVIVLILSKIFFSYGISLTWDSSEYFGLASLIGTDKMQKSWIAHRGIGFPWLMKLSQGLDKVKTDGLMKLMYSFYLCMLLSIYLVYKKLRKEGFLKNKFLIAFFLVYITYCITLNPMLFGYYHTALTEFVGITEIALICTLCWWWTDFTWEDNRIGSIVIPIILTLSTILLYHVKQSFIAIALIPILSSAILSIFNNFNYKNVVAKLSGVAVVGVSLVHSIRLWGFFMSNTKAGAIYYLKLLFLISGIAVAIALVGVFINKMQKSEKICKYTKISAGVLALVLIIGIFNYYSFDYDIKDGVPVAKTETTTANKDKETEGIDVLETTYNRRLNNCLITGIFGYRVGDSNNFKQLTTEQKKETKVGGKTEVTVIPPKIDRSLITEEDNIRIDKILNGEVKNKFFNLYRNKDATQYFAYFHDAKDSFKNQLDFCLRIILNYPKVAYDSYKQTYWDIVFVKEGDFSPYERENFNITAKIYTPGVENVVDVNKNYEKFIQDYRSFVEENSLNYYMTQNIHRLITLMELALWYSPIMLILAILIYLFLRIFHNTPANKGRISLLQFIIILFATTFGGVMSYVVMGTKIDRYIISFSLSAFLAYFLSGVIGLEFLVYIIKEKVLKNYQENATKRQTKEKTKV